MGVILVSVGMTMMTMRHTFVVLVAIAVVGALGIPLGDPRFLHTSMMLEGIYIALAVLAFKAMSMRRRKLVVIPSVALASIVITANTLSTTHVNIMMSLTPLYNALILIVGGYILQALLIVSSIYEYSRVRLANFAG